MSYLEDQYCWQCLNIERHENGKCCSCASLDIAQKKLKKEEHWNSLDTKQKLDYLFNNMSG